MKVGRNDPCPCNSGKKYKKCCMLKKDDANEGGATKTRQNLKKYSDEEINSLVEAVYNLHRFMLEEEPHIKEYEKLRKMHGEIMSSMMQYYQDGKFIPGLDGDYSAQTMSAYGKGNLALMNMNFDLETKEGNQALGDILVYKAAPNMNCITEDYINSKRFRKLEKVEFLQSMLNSRIGLFKVVDVERDEGYVHLEEVFCGVKFKITDIGLSGEPANDRFYLYTRIITHRDISFNTGLNIVFLKNDPFIKDFIKRNKKDYSSNSELVRFNELYNRYTNTPERVRTIGR